MEIKLEAKDAVQRQGSLMSTQPIDIANTKRAAGCSLSASACSRCAALEAEIARLREALDWQNMPNRREPVRGGYEFYINEEWTGIRDAALGEDAGFQATLMKTRFDPDDERVRVRRVIDDDALLADARKSSANSPICVNTGNECSARAAGKGVG